MNYYMILVPIIKVFNEMNVSYDRNVKGRGKRGTREKESASKYVETK